jgi:uncharacterized protein
MPHSRNRGVRVLPSRIGRGLGKMSRVGRLERLSREIESLSGPELDLLADLVASKIAHESWPPVTKLELFVTSDCNLRCRYCWVDKEPLKTSLETAKSAVDFLICESRGSESIHITLFGGEPLLEFDMIAQLVPYAKDEAARCGKSLSWSLTTNGTLLDEEKMAFGAKWGLNYLVSLDGQKPEHDMFRVFPDGSGSFDTVVEAIERYGKYQPWIGVRMTVNPETVDHLAEGVRFMRGIGVKQFIIAPANDRPWPPEAIESFAEQWEAVARIYMDELAAGRPIRITNFEQSIEESKRMHCGAWGCEAGRDKVCVTPDGLIWPCGKFVDPAIGDEAALGSLKDGITNLALRGDLMDSRGSVRFNCLDCSEKDSCSGCCPAVNLKMLGSIYQSGGIECAVTKIFNDTIRRHPELPQARKLEERPA